jgi:hypothetical protein
MKNKIITVNAGILIIAIAFAVLNIYWLVFPRKIVEFNTNPMEVVTKEVERGGSLIYVADVCKYVNIPALTSTSFRNGLIYTATIPADNIYTNKDVGCAKTPQVAKVPNDLPVGEYIFRIVLVYELNPIRKESFTIETEPFLVIR